MIHYRVRYLIPIDSRKVFSFMSVQCAITKMYVCVFIPPVDIRSYEDVTGCKYNFTFQHPTQPSPFKLFPHLTLTQSPRSVDSSTTLTIPPTNALPLDYADSSDRS